MTDMNYQDQIKHPNWQKKRLEILQRDDFKCCDCDSSNNSLHVHHKQYTKNSMIWEYDDSNLITLCDKCHNEHHKLKAELNKIISNLANEGLEALLSIIPGLIKDDDLFKIVWHTINAYNKRFNNE